MWLTKETINVRIYILELIRSVVNYEFTERIDSLISVSDNKQRIGSSIEI